MVTRLLGIVGALLLAACTTLPAAPPLETGSSATRWQLQGKVGIWSGDTRESARVTWLQCGAALRIDISGVVGGTAARLSGDDRGVVLQQAGEPDRRAPDADTLLADLGWPLPASALRWWIFAEPVPAQPHDSSRDDDGRMLQLNQTGWSIAFSRFRPVDSRELPAVIDLARDDLRFRILIAEQDLTPAACDRL